MTIDGFLANPDEWTLAQMPRLKAYGDARQLLEAWRGVSYEEVPADFVALPYYNALTGNLSYIPIKMISKMYMSNGMCAGNTPSEALVQGISEVLERYANIKIVQEKITPPDIPAEYLRCHPKIKSMIEQIEGAGNYRIIMKDCSLGLGLPVVGAIFIDRDEKKYFVKFGAHPVFEIAAERTLTEMLQGQNVQNMMGLRPFSYRGAAVAQADNLMGILVNGAGYYPPEFFSAKSSYTYGGCNYQARTDNTDMLAWLIKLVKRVLGSDTYIRDVSYLGFPCYHVIIPGVSEIETIDNIAEINDYTEYNKVKKVVRDIAGADRDDLGKVIRFLDRFGRGSGASVADLLSLPLTEELPWYYVNVQLFQAALCYRAGDYLNSYRKIDDFTAHGSGGTLSRQFDTFFRCLRDYVGTRADGMDDEEAILALCAFYPAELIRGIIAEFKNNEEIFNQYGQFKCWQCGQCQFAAKCAYRVVEKVYLAIKDRYALAAVNQSDIGKVVKPEE